MAKLLDITIGESGIVEFPGETVQSEVSVAKIPDPIRRQPKILDISVSEGGIIEDTPQQIVEQPPEELGFFEGIKDVFTGESRTTPEVEATPELISTRGVTTGSFGKDIKTAAGLFFATGDEEKKDIIQENFPDAKISEDKFGNVFINFPDGKKSILNKPGFSGQDAANVIQDIALFFGAGKLATLGKGLLSRLAIGGGATAATEAGRQIVAQQFGSKQQLSPADIALAAGTGGAGELIRPAAQAIKRGIQRVPGVRKIAGGVLPEKALGVPVEDVPGTQAAVTEAKELSEILKTDFLQAQQTLDPAQLELQSFLPSLPAASRKAARILENQNKQMSDAVQRFMDTIASPESIETAEGEIVSVAKQAIKARKTLRSEIADPFYDEAKKDPQLLKLPETQKLIAEIRSDFKVGGDIDKLLARVEKKLFTKKVVKSSLLDVSGKKIPDKVVNVGMNIKELHGSKIEIDKLINKFGDDSLSNTEKRLVVQIKDSYLGEIDDANSAYKLARAAFEARSPAVKELQDGIIGKIAKLNDTQLKSISTTLFNPAETNPIVIKNAKKIIEAQDPQAWRDIVRLEFEKRLGSIPPPKKGEAFINRPGRIFRALFEPSKRRRVLFAALDTETAKNLTFLEEGLRRASLGRPGGSQTATRTEITKALRGGFGNVIRRFIERPVSSLGKVGVSMLSGAAEDVSFNNRVRALADTMFNPKWQPDLKEIRKLNPNSVEAGNKFFKLLKDVEKPLLQATRPRISEEEIKNVE